MWWWLGFGIERALERSLASLACSLQLAVGRNRRKGVGRIVVESRMIEWSGQRAVKLCLLLTSVLPAAAIGGTQLDGAVPGAEEVPGSCASERLEVDSVDRII